VQFLSQKPEQSAACGLDLKSEEGARRVFLRMAEQADVVVE